ncbi:MAG TPA: glutamate racemase [Gammaproteobacteria bacterium]|nr:glutamate racemase [Gammaproteobacteria bacterium]
MKTINSASPIGIFDSGIGGLTVTQALVRLLPNESIIYFGDTAHHPYGEKSAAAIQSYSVKIANFFLEQNCKLILVACNTASSVAYELLKEYVGTRALVINVIDPLVIWLSKNYPNKKIGLIGTKRTVSSNIYKKKIDELKVGIELNSYATNLLASAIEEFGNHEIIANLLNVYLQHSSLQNIKALILACTHYPIVKDKIAAFYNNNVDIIDSSEIVAQAVKSQLADANLLNEGSAVSKNFYISDYIESFVNGTKLFFNENVALQHYPLWD